MANKSFKKQFKNNGYTHSMIIRQIIELKKNYDEVSYSSKKDLYAIELFLRPSDVSKKYKIKMICRVGKKYVKIFVVNPKLKKTRDNRIPHMYPDNSLCLFYYKYGEWNMHDSWSRTLIPWTSLWLLYYEFWKETGEWFGGGVHDKMLP